MLFPILVAVLGLVVAVAVPRAAVAPEAAVGRRPGPTRHRCDQEFCFASLVPLAGVPGTKITI